MKAAFSLTKLIATLGLVVLQLQPALADPPSNCSSGTALTDYNTGLTDYMSTTCAAISQTINMLPDCSTAESRAQFASGFLVMRATIAYVKAKSACTLNTAGTPSNPELCDGYTDYLPTPSSSFVPEGVWNYNATTNALGLFNKDELNSASSQTIFQNRLANIINNFVTPALNYYQPQGSSCGSSVSALWTVLPLWSSDILQTGVY